MAQSADRQAPSAASGTACNERAERVARLGYRTVEAEFLTAAALLGGFFLRRQFRAFSGAGQGGAETRLVRRAEANGHLRFSGGRPHLYRLCGASLFRAVGCEDPGTGRARRAVKQRLLVLDYWIATHGQQPLLVASADKAAWCAGLGIGEDDFPVAVRTRRNAPTCFPDRFPIGIGGADRASVRFTYAHAGASAAGLQRCLRRHEPLARSLAQRGFGQEWIVLADSQAQFARLRQAWERWLARAERDWSEGEYFALRHRVDKLHWKELSRKAVERYARLRAQHGGAGAEQRYRDWARRGAPARPPGGDFPRFCRFREVLMEFDYAAADAAWR